MQVFDITREEYIAVLETEVETLSRYYYKPETEGTGNYNTTIGVLKHRIEELKNVGKSAHHLAARRRK